MTVLGPLVPSCGPVARDGILTSQLSFGMTPDRWTWQCNVFGHYLLVS